MMALELKRVPISEEQFYQLCADNRDLRLERSADGNIIVMPPTGGLSGHRNTEIAFQLHTWNKQRELGVVFGSSTGYYLPNSAVRAPDASWITSEKWNSLAPSQKEKFLPFSPDFAIELMSPTDTLAETRKKMVEYLDNGMRLGWLINPKTQSVEIYRPSRETEILNEPQTLSGENVLPNFILDLNPIWG
jgi:Uma2 family endonuclease